MIQHTPVLIVIVPLVAALLVPLVALRSMVGARALVLLALLGVVACSGVALTRALAAGPLLYELGDWEAPWGIVYVLDPLSGGMALLIGLVAILVAVYTNPYLDSRSPGRAGVFLSLFLLLVTGLLGIVVTGDLFNLYVFLEISSLAGYALLASGGIRSAVATFRYLIIGTIAATFYLLGIGYLYALTGSLNMADVAVRLNDIDHSGAFAVAITFIVVGLSIKAALFPLHGWLPDAYTYAPAPVIGFISAVMAKVSAYALFRVLYFVLRPVEPVSQLLAGLSWVAAIAILAASVLAIAQRDVRRMLAYSSIGQMGYIFLGLALGTPSALRGALLHVLNHAIMKACLFLVAGGVQWRTGGYRLEDFKGMSRRMPLTMAAMVLAAISMIGLPPTAGFFSKWYLIEGAIEAHAWVFVAVLIGSSLLSAIYFFRLIEWAYLRQPTPQTPVVLSSSQQELPMQMLVPIWVLATGVMLLGLFNQAVVNGIIQYAILPEGS
jgi:multicomponent Na+:H+ antiporter subunit D